MTDTTTPKTPAASTLHPTIFVIFGITGDLASRKLLPALLSLYSKKLLPNRFAIVGFSRRNFSREEFREYIRSRLNVKPGQFKEEDIKHFLDHMSYEQGYFDMPSAYQRLSEKLQGIDMRWGQCSNKLFHLSVPPNLYEGILQNLSDSDLTKPCDDETGWTRVLIEKPFGNDLETARSLDRLLGKLFKEEQIFRIDHYLAKEALQNMMTFRFMNPMFEPLWDREHVDRVHIKLFESLSVEGRADTYDTVGALKDVGQNHMLAMLAIIAMNKPKSWSPADIRRERAFILGKLKKIPPRSLKDRAVKGQYVGYASETGVGQQSSTETYFRLETHLDTPRWKGVPFFLESGKAMGEAKTEIDIYFKENILTFRIQPDEGIKIKFLVKRPGYDFSVEPKTLKFKYADVPSFAELPNDYERLIHDAFAGDQTLFASTDEIMASWKFIASIQEAWKLLPLVTYQKGAKEI